MGAKQHFLMRRCGRGRLKWRCNVLAYNLTRVMNIVGVRPLLAAIQERECGTVAPPRHQVASGTRAGSMQKLLI